MRKLETMLRGTLALKLEKGGEGLLVKSVTTKKLKAEGLNLFCIKFIVCTTKSQN